MPANQSLQAAAFRLVALLGREIDFKARNGGQCVTCTAAFTSMSALGRHFQDAHQQGKPDGHGRLEIGGASFADNAAAERELMMFESVRTESQATQKRVLRASKACAAPAPTLDGFTARQSRTPLTVLLFAKLPIGMIQGSGCTGVALRQETRCGRR